MITFTLTETNSAFSKLQQLTARLLRMHRNGGLHSIPHYKQLSIVKRYNRCLNKMVKTNHPISKAMGLIAIAMLCSMESPAQAPCRQFVNAEKDSPFKRLKLPFQITKPVFIDIDNDGDLDCYCAYPDPSYNVKFAFLRNTGTKKIPSFKFESTGGLPDETTIYFSNKVEGLVFADLDGDGDYDCFIGNYGGNYDNDIVYFENVGSKNNPSFVERSGAANPLNFVGGAYGLYFNLVDIDADGDYDLYTFDLYFNDFYRNTGTKTNPQFVRISHEDKVVNLKNAHTIFTDWTKDGLPDLIKTDLLSFPASWDNKFFINDGPINNPHYTKDVNNGPVFPGGFNLYSLADLNNDGFQEAFSYTGTMASTAPVATITAIKSGQEYTLKAHPKGNYTYQWLRNRVKLVNETKDSLEVTQPGNYIVQITGNCGTGISLPHKVTINNPVASSGNEQDMPALINTTAQLHVYPNPFTNECVLQFHKGITGNLKIYITDAQGRMVATLKANNNTMRFGKELPAGIYFIQVMNDKEIILRQKVIKQ